MHHITIRADIPPHDDDYLGLKEQLAYTVETAIDSTPRDIDIRLEPRTNSLIFTMALENVPADGEAKLAAALSERFGQRVRVEGVKHVGYAQIGLEV